MFKKIITHFQNKEVDKKYIFGRQGEIFVRELLIKNKYNIYCNRIIKNEGRGSGFLEADIILNRGKTIFVIEIKRMKGKIFRTNEGLIQEKIFYTNPLLRTFKPYEARKIKDPKNQVKRFTIALKKNLIQKDSRFSTIKFIPVVAFSNEADISDIYSFKEGIIYFSDLLNFIERNKTNKSCPNWVEDGLKTLKGYDIIMNRAKNEIVGLIIDSNFVCITKEKRKRIMRKRIINFREIKSIKTRKRNIFSPCVNLDIHKKNGEILNLDCYKPAIKLNTFSSIQTYYIKNLIEVKVESR